MLMMTSNQGIERSRIESPCSQPSPHPVDLIGSGFPPTQDANARHYQDSETFLGSEIPVATPSFGILASWVDPTQWFL